MELPVYHISRSEVNGPGLRLVVWVQGCRLRCKNCFNPETHAFDSSKAMKVGDILDIINNDKEIEGITFSGGEPLEYPKAVLEVLNNIRPGLTSIVFSGYRLEEVLESPDKRAVAKKADMCILGRYDDSLNHPYAGKKFVRSTEAIDMEYFTRLYNVEYAINGVHVTKSGIFKLK